MTDDRHLFGLPDAEHMQFDLETVYEEWADANLEPWPSDLTSVTVTIEEWTTAPLAYHYIDYITEHVAERVAEDGDEILYDSLANAGQKADVVAAFQAAVDLMLSKVGYRMAGELIATHVITHDAGCRPMLNGERLFPEVDE
jgi:hypothetical protein